MAQVNQTVRGPMAATSDVTPVYKHRRESTPFQTMKVMVYGTWVGTVSLQTSDPDRGVWITEDSWTANGSMIYTPGANCDIRCIFTSRTSGTPIGAIINA